ncbi:hypothetical protein KQX54_017336 [Cotesia glomerata]|uniref:Gustatory receptor n=1 Tax=Cotesia glomerata TaxID=32391 RepID=A0AAV7HXZ9_COTGL|nr:hypothetical protein KQX54_017336 [Cotesia glomerata]
MIKKCTNKLEKVETSFVQYKFATGSIDHGQGLADDLIKRAVIDTLDSPQRRSRAREIRVDELSIFGFIFLRSSFTQLLFQWLVLFFCCRNITREAPMTILNRMLPIEKEIRRLYEMRKNNKINWPTYQEDFDFYFSLMLTSYKLYAILCVFVVRGRVFEMTNSLTAAAKPKPSILYVLYL